MPRVRAIGSDCGAPDWCEGLNINRDSTVDFLDFALLAGCIATARRARTNDGRIMGFVTIEDSSGLAEVTFFPDKIGQYQNLASASGLVWVNGRVCEHLSSITLQCHTSGPA